MNEVEKIKTQILSDAKKEANSILSDAKKEANSLKKEADSKLRFETQKLLDEGKKEASIETQRIHSSANLRVNNLRLQSQEQLIQKVLADSMKKLKELQKSGNVRYEKGLDTLIKAGKKELGAEQILILLNNQDQALGKKLASNYKANVKLAEIEGGVIVQTPDGSLCVNNSFEQRMERYSNLLRGKIAKILQ